jgi:hypothetical protein
MSSDDKIHATVSGGMCRQKRRCLSHLRLLNQVREEAWAVILPGIRRGWHGEVMAMDRASFNSVCHIAMLAAWLAVLTLGIFATALSVDGCYSSGLLITDISLWESVSCQCRLGSGALGFGLTQARPLLLRHPQPGQTKSPPLSLLFLHSCPAFNIRRGAIPAVALPSPSSRRHCSLFPPRPSTRLAAHPPHASHAHHPARPPPPGRHPDTPRQRLPLGDARTLDALTEILARYLALLAARDNHGSATPDVTDARMAMADGGLLTPAAMAAQEVWL